MMSQRALVILFMVVLFVLTLALALLFRVSETVPAFLNGKEYLQTVADVIQLIMWFVGGGSFIWRWLLPSADSQDRPGINVQGNTVIGDGNKIRVKGSGASIRDNRIKGNNNEIDAE